MNTIEKYDFFADGKKDFYNKFSHKSILCQGKHWEKNPFVTILIPTYKRPELLRRALESALKQKGFDDYQIIVVDNEGESVDKETATVRLVKEYANEKVVYYRHDRELTYRMDAAVRLAKSPWIVFLHDDDILADDHLKIMTNIVNKHREIKFLACRAKDVMSEEEVEKEERKRGLNRYSVYRRSKKLACLGDWDGWLGALISRKHYIAIGGMPSIAMGCGDRVMAGKFLHHFGTYVCRTDKPLYYYRRGTQQSSYTQKNTWEKVIINEFIFDKYVINKCHKLTHRIWEKNLEYYILDLCKAYNEGLYDAQIDLEHVIQECNMSANLGKRNDLLIKVMIEGYKNMIRIWDYVRVDILKNTDIHVLI